MIILLTIIREVIYHILDLKIKGDRGDPLHGRDFDHKIKDDTA